MLTRRIRTACAVLALGCAVIVAGCTSEEGATGGSSSGNNTLEEVIDRGELRVAVLPDFPPFSVQNASGEFEGYEVDIAQELADALEVDLKLVSTDGSSRLPLLKADRVDVNISSWTATDERAKAVGYTIPYIADGASVLYRSGTNIDNYDDLANMKVSVARGSTNDTIVTEEYPDAEIVRFESIADAIAALEANKVDAAVEGRATVLQEAKDNKGLEALDAPPLRPSLISMGVLPDDQIWLDYLNNFIRNMNASGTNEALYQKWFNESLPEVIG